MSKEIPWDSDARERVERAPEFVRSGILKLMQKRANDRGKDKIGSEFLSEIRDESMMLVTRRMKKFGFDNLTMNAWATAKEKFKKIPAKSETIDIITTFLGKRPEKNDSIVNKFESFFGDTVGDKMGWTKGARERIANTPDFIRPMVISRMEKYARERGYKYVTEQTIDEVMEKLPFMAAMKGHNPGELP